MRKLLAPFLLSWVVTGSILAQALSAEIYQPKAVVELFTSQGCHSCPPADKIIEKFSKGKDILGLSWHVDYWDYLGWKDTFASRSNTQRQYGYAATFRSRQVYTPQAVINGRVHEVGSREGLLVNRINEFTGSPKGLVVPINADMDEDSITIKIGNSSAGLNSTLYMVHFNSTETVKIARGENGGKTLSYHNVVHESQALGMLKASGLNMQFPLSEVKKLGFDSTALILQKLDGKGNPGAIVGALVITDFKDARS